MKIKKSYKFRIYPTPIQSQLLTKTFGCCRFIWNKMLSDKIEHYNQTKQMLKNTPAQYKSEFEWLKEVDSLALANIQQDLQMAYHRFFKGTSSFPKFKKKAYAQSYTTNSQKGSIRIENKKIKLPKLGWVKIKQHRPINGLIKRATISQNSSGNYFISLLVEGEQVAYCKTGSKIGVDLGISNLAILSNGEKAPNLKILNTYQKRLTKEQRILSRRLEQAKKDGKPLSEAKNYQKQRKKVAKIHQKIQNIRKDYLNKLTHNLVKNHDMIVIEDLASSNLMKNRKLSRAISDVSWYEFKRQLQYKCDWYGKLLVVISRWFPSSQICSTCKVNTGKKALDIRNWTCPSCHCQHDRDINAAKNILNEGLRLLAQC